MLELKLKALIMDCIYFIDVVCSRHQEHQGVAVAEAAQVRLCMHAHVDTRTYVCMCL